MSGKRKQDEEGEEYDNDMGSTACQSSEESTSTEESDFDDDKKTKQILEFKQILKALSKTVPRKNECPWLTPQHGNFKKYFMYFLTPKGEMLYRNRRIPVANIAEFCECILLPYNAEVPKPRALI